MGSQLARELHMDEIGPTVSDAERVLREAWDELKRLRAAVTRAREEVERAKAALAVAKALLKESRTPECPL